MSGDARGGGATAGALHVVSTPIGNLADLTPRAAAVLREVALIVAEDTRVARTLLEGLGIDRPVESLPAFDERARIAPILARLNGGESVALISDAGTPLISDPGQHLVAAAIASGVRVVPIPGASALLAAVVASGIVGARWVFEGFLPRSGGERERGSAHPEAGHDGPRVHVGGAVDAHRILTHEAEAARAADEVLAVRGPLAAREARIQVRQHRQRPAERAPARHVARAAVEV